jgi:hypothetical protein
MTARTIFLWLAVVAPLLWGIIETLHTAMRLLQ